MIRARLKTPRAAAIAGILFAVLLIISLVLLRLSVRSDPLESGAWLKTRSNTVALGLNLMPFAGIAFLWFIGVLRDRKNGFKKRLEHFMRCEEMKRPQLHRQLQAFRATSGRLGAKSWLFPRDPEIFDALSQELRNNKRALLLHLRAVAGH